MEACRDRAYQLPDDPPPEKLPPPPEKLLLLLLEDHPLLPDDHPPPCPDDVMANFPYLLAHAFPAGVFARMNFAIGNPIR